MSLWMAGFDGVPLTRGGWTFFLPDYDARYSEELREELIDSAFAAIDGTLATRVRRSRHAETWSNRFEHAGGPQAYFKVLDPIRGLSRVRWIFKRRRAAHVASVSEHLRADGIEVAEILLLGAERRGGREIIVTSRIDGFNLVRHLKRATACVQARRFACARRGSRADASRGIHPRRPDSVQHFRNGNRSAEICFHRS